MEISSPSNSPPPMSEDCTQTTGPSSVGSIDSRDNNNNPTDRMGDETEPQQEQQPADENSSSARDTSTENVQQPTTERRSVFGHLSSENLQREADDARQAETVDNNVDDPAIDAEPKVDEEPGCPSDSVRHNAAMGPVAEQDQEKEEPFSNSMVSAPEQEMTTTQEQKSATPLKEAEGEADKEQIAETLQPAPTTSLHAEEHDMGLYNTPSTDSFVRVDDEADTLAASLKENEQELTSPKQTSLSSSPSSPEANTPREKLTERLPHRPAPAATSTTSDVTIANTANHAATSPMKTSSSSSPSSPESSSSREKLIERLPHRPETSAIGTTSDNNTANEAVIAVPESVNFLPRDLAVPAQQQVELPTTQSPSLVPQQQSPLPSPSRQLVSPVVQFAQPQQMQQVHPTGSIIMQHQQQQPATFIAQVPVQQPPGTMRPTYETLGGSISYTQPGRRCIRLRLVEEDLTAPLSSPVKQEGEGRRGGLRLLGSFRKTRGRGRTMSDIGIGRVGSPTNVPNELSHQESSNSVASGVSLIDRGTISVSWYDGTGSVELNEHVMKSVRRKLDLGGEATLQDVRIIDESIEPNEEIVLCPYIPDGSEFLLKFSIKDKQQAQEKRSLRVFDSFISEAPESPSAAPSPYPSSLDLAHLKQILTASGLMPSSPSSSKSAKEISMLASNGPKVPPLDGLGEKSLLKNIKPKDSVDSSTDKMVSFQSPVKTPNGKLVPQKEGDSKEVDKVQDVLRQLNELLGVQDGTDGHNHRHRRTHRDRNEEKKQVVFVLANYFVLFLSLIVISAEIHERAPRWMDWVNTHVDSVQSCSKDSDALYKCVSEGNLAGLVASFIFWITRSAATKNILLFGFDSPKKLWTVVYEALVTALCWGTSYIFIRRGLNPDTRRHFLHKYWKDAIYGSLAGFNAAFLKAVLKNLIPQDQVLDAFETRQLRVVDWVSHLFRSGKVDIEDF